MGARGLSTIRFSFRAPRGGYGECCNHAHSAHKKLFAKMRAAYAKMRAAYAKQMAPKGQA